MTIRRILLWVALGLLVLVAGRVAGLFLLPLAALWLWRVLIAPFVLVGAIVAFVLLVTIVLCLGRIKYLVDAEIGQDKTALVEVRYLMGLVHFVFTYKDGTADSRTRVAWMQLGQDKPPKKKKRKKKREEKDVNPAAVHEISASVTSKPSTEPDISVSTAKDDPPPESEPSQNEKKDRLKPLKQAKAVLTYPDRKIIIGLCFQCLQKFVRALKPKRLDIHGVVGFDDPATTGWFMGAYEAAVGIMQLRRKVRLLGNYMEKALELNIQAQGRTRLWGLIWPFVWLYLHKPIRVVIHKHIMRKDDEDE